VAEAINVNLYAAVSFGPDACFNCAYGYLYIEPIWYPDGAGTGTIWAEIQGDFDFFDHEEPAEFFNFCARWCFDEFIEGWVYACGTIFEGDGVPDYLTYQGYIVGEFITDTLFWVTDGGFHLFPNGKLLGEYEFFEQFDVFFCGDYRLGGSLLKSTDGGRAWEKTGYEDVEYEIDIYGDTFIGSPGPVVDMVCSSIKKDIIYFTDGHYVYESTDGDDEFTCIDRDSLEEMLEGE